MLLFILMRVLMLATMVFRRGHKLITVGKEVPKPASSHQRELPLLLIGPLLASHNPLKLLLEHRVL